MKAFSHGAKKLFILNMSDFFEKMYIDFYFQMKATNVTIHSNIVDREKRSAALGTGKFIIYFNTN